MTEQWIFCDGSPSRNLTMSSLRILSASIGVYSPFSMISQRASLEAIALVQPNVEYLAAMMTSSTGFSARRTLKKNFIASPQAIEPCSPTPSASAISPKWLFSLPLTAFINNIFVLSLYCQAITNLLNAFLRGDMPILGIPRAPRSLSIFVRLATSISRF